ncbi:MAG TPA: DUF1761 domain-containing protein [Allosphingosinicella sp.]|nr:DUF1761 domain-containing protein [Allosphingosinicella sp.]
MDLNLVWAALAGGALGALADWPFSAVLFRGRHELYPDTWRRGGEGKRIAASLLLALVTATAFVALANKLNQTDLRGGLKLAAMIWLIGPLPLLAAHALSIRIDPLVVASHAAGWLAKLLAIGAATAWFL